MKARRQHWFLNGSVRWSRPSDWNILHDYAGARKETWKFLQPELDPFHCSHAAMPDLKMLQTQSGISSAFQDRIDLFLELMVAEPFLSFCFKSLHSINSDIRCVDGGHVIVVKWPLTCDLSVVMWWLHLIPNRSGITFWRLFHAGIVQGTQFGSVGRVEKCHNFDLVRCHTAVYPCRPNRTRAPVFKWTRVHLSGPHHSAGSVHATPN